MDANQPSGGAENFFGGPGPDSIQSRAILPLLDSDPREVGPYLIRGRLGQGAMGHVYLAFAPPGPAYAIKVLRPDFAGDGEFRRRFAREVDAARSVHSPFVNAVTDADPHAQTPWLASHFIPGPPLNVAVNLAGPFPPRSVAHLGVGIGLALQAIHTAGVVHRDLKPGNVLIASDGPRVIDFGIARASDASMLTSTGMRLGTPSFMAPEQVSGDVVGAAADVWAVGGMLVYAATGRTPFGDGNAMAILYRVEHHEPDLAGMDPALAAIASQCLAKDAEARPTPAKLIEMCRAALYGGVDSAPALAGADPTGWLSPAIAQDLASRAVELAAAQQALAAQPVAEPTKSMFGRKAKGSQEAAATPAPPRIIVGYPAPTITPPAGAAPQSAPVDAPQQSYNRAYPTPVALQTAPMGTNKRLAVIAGVVVLAIGGAAAAALARSGTKNTPTPQPGVIANGTQHPPYGASTPPTQDPSTSTAAEPPATGIPGHAPGQPGAEDVVLRGLYAAAADRNYALICSSETPGAQQSAARKVGWTGAGDAVPLCQKYFQLNWGAAEPRRLRAVKVMRVDAGRDANHLIIVVSDPPPDGKGPTRPIAVTWNGTRWLLG